MKRLLYLIYYLKNLDWKQMNKFSKYVYKNNLFLLPIIGLKVIVNSLKYNISPLEYFQFRFFEKNHTEKGKWAGTGYMYQYQLKMNPDPSRNILIDKIKFLDHFSQFVNHKYIDINKSPIPQYLLAGLLSNSPGKLVLKNSLGQVGAEVEVVNCNNFSTDSLLAYMNKKGYNLLEEYVIQHPLLMELSPSALNTMRIITQINQEGRVDLLGARLRISVNSQVDNMGAGNLAASIDIESGIVNGPGVYSDITKPDEIIHPVTGIKIEGFQIPFWAEALELAIKAAQHRPESRSVGWDIAITANGPELIEGNHNWCKLLWQLPVNKGLKQVLESYIKQ